MDNFVKQFRVEPGSKVKLRDIDPGFHGEYTSREEAAGDFETYLKKLDDLQYLMYSERKHSLLIVFQAIDAGGKDGVIRRVITGMNPSGVRVVSFKQPTAVELSHDFLWRVHPQAPAKGEVTVFNRSHYEDVLVVRVHELVPKEVWSQRYGLINAFERLLAEQNNTTILKFFLYISPEEQLERFKERLEDPAKQWKISESDYTERAYWDKYLDAYEEAFEQTSKAYAPWYVIPANRKWFRDVAIARIIAETLEGLAMRMPEPSVDIEAIRKQYHAAVEKMKKWK